MSSDLAAGIGSPCTSDADCHASVCRANRCSLTCTGDADCPAGAPLCRSQTCAAACESQAECPGGAACVDGVCAPGCDSAGDGSCDPNLVVGFVYVGDPNVQAEEWSRVHEAGRAFAQAQLTDVVLDFRFVARDATQAENPKSERDIGAAMDALIEEGADYIVATAPEMAGEAEARAERHPDLKFLTFAARPPKAPNHIAYSGEMYKAAWVAGYLAGYRSRAHRLSFIGAYATPSVVTQVEGFALGAAQAKPETKLFLRWLKDGDVFPTDASLDARERELALELVGIADILAYRTDTIAPLDVMARVSDRWAVGNMEDSCRAYDMRCMAMVYWNFGPFYARLLDRVRRGEWPELKFWLDPFVVTAPKAQRATTEDSLVNFGFSDAFWGSPDQNDIEAKNSTIFLLQEIARGQEGGSTWEPPNFPILSDSDLMRRCEFAAGSPIFDGTTFDEAARSSVPSRGDCVR